MNVFRNPFLLVVLLCSLFLVKCTCDDDTTGDPDTTSLVETISKEWKISTLTVNGDAVSDTEDFVLELNQSGDAPTTFTVTTGGVAYNFAGATSGSWSLDNNDAPTQATFAGKTVDFTASASQLTISYDETAADGKPEPAVRFVLVPKI
ncbi:hypothetical protein Fleli_1853 [Bernardetia litoralis DSM 6794]|uniref:Lipocalin-like domain-containing protein n=1 Tax=Bernardetia litoralis (strain ATCC 23117 / DSM 6794 / NBRC 15988 / NCIMB 1366 / Fx l1 / Sio-4) TaxID=880071 RepID=I4AJW6_BERLS|nr:DUF5004 domain-containing protein [Bernardetia litoralis]AFM04251.1 hypothetical protein Fleli_1853 [Bernardetia litoralis DSM 6794]